MSKVARCNYEYMTPLFLPTMYGWELKENKQSNIFIDFFYIKTVYTKHTIYILVFIPFTVTRVATRDMRYILCTVKTP